MAPSHLKNLESAIYFGDRRQTASILDQFPNLLNERFADNLDLTPLMWACRNRRESIVLSLLRRGADVSADNRVEPNGDGGNTALWFTAQGSSRGTTGIARHLLSAGASVDKSGEHGQTPLYIATAWCHLDLVQELIDHGADPYRPNSAGVTPLVMLRQFTEHLRVQPTLTPDQHRFQERAPHLVHFFENLGS